MDSYLMMLYVTLEQESALKNFFVDQGWKFCKPDLTVTTDKLGPSTGKDQTVNQSSNTGNSPTLIGKRKAASKQNAPVVKMAKIIPSELVSAVNKEHTVVPVLSDMKVVDGFKETELLDIGVMQRDSSLPSNEADLEVETFNVNYNPEEDVDEDEDTDVDYNFEDSKKETDIKAEENEFENFVTVTKLESEDVNAEEQAIAEAATEPKELKERKRKTLVPTNAKEGAPKCVTCQHFEEQAIILEKGPGLPDKDAHEPNVFICDVCGKQFIHQNTYKRHLQSHEIPNSSKCVRERKWKCLHCEKVFGSEANLKEHVNRVHLRKPGEFMCHLCPKSYTRAGRLQAHLNTHFGIRPYSCRSCLTTFHGKASLVEHQKKCEGGITVRFKCQLCLEYFNSQIELKHHRANKHADVFVSSPCGKKIRWKSSLKKHTATCVKCKDIETAKQLSGNP